MDEQLARELEKLRTDLGALRSQLIELDARLAALSRRVQTQSGLETARAASPPPAPVPPPTPAAAHEPVPLRPPAAVATTAPAFQPPPLPAVPAAPPAKPKASLEQRVGTSWLNKIGIVIVILAAVFFFQYALQQGWINRPLQVACAAVAGLALLALGEWAFRKGWRIFAAGVTGGGVALLYVATFVAGPKVYGLIGTPAAFGCMCVVSAIGMALSLRSGMITTAILAQVGAYLTPVLLSTGQDQQIALLSYLLVADAAFLILAAIKRWGALAPISLGATAMLFMGWFFKFYTAAAWAPTVTYGWTFFALFVAYAATGTALRRTHQFFGIALTAAVGGLLALLIVALRDDGLTVIHLEAFVQLLVLDVVVLGVCLLRKWHALRAGVLAWTMLLLSVEIADSYGPAGDATYLSVWIWVFHSLFAADCVVRACWRGRATNEPLDAALLSIATAAMFAATYFLLREIYPRQMGLYAASLAAALLSLAWFLRRHTDRRILPHVLLGKALVLLALAVPIQWDKATVSIAWAAQSLVAMFLAKRLGGKLLPVKAVIVLGLAICHFVAVDLPDDHRLAGVAFSVGAVDIRYVLLLAAGLTAAALGLAAIVRIGKAVWSDLSDPVMACIFVAAGACLWAWQTCAQLPVVAATWWWLALALCALTVGLWRSSRWLTASALVALAATCVKFLLYDTLGLRLAGPPQHWWLVANWQFGAAVALAVALTLAGRAIPPRFKGRFPAGRAAPGAGLLAALLIVWAGSFEVDRYFATAGASVFENVTQARQMGLSIWWAVFAAAILATGFAVRKALLRYFALLVFGVTLGKVLLLDMAGVELAYRIGSFLALGLLLVAASFLYQRYFRMALASWDKEVDRPMADD